ncbi:MAG: hypothetical protein GXO39_01025 [Thermotogae bacterium]|nr:hypothetical protein [Thermotogota bacterium]
MLEFPAYELVKIEEKEKEILFRLAWIFKESLNDFGTSVDRSLRYLEKIILPIIMASKKDRAYNPFSEIIEKYVLHILHRKLGKFGYNLLPLGYSSDLTLEDENHILNIDVKTANLDNPGDFKKTINVGINQMTHVARLRINKTFLPPPYFVYPNLPPFYEMEDGQRKLILTYGFIFIYPPYRDLIDDVRKDYNDLLNLFQRKVVNVLQAVLKLTDIEDSKPSQSKIQSIAENLIRGVFIHRCEKNVILKSLGISEGERIILERFYHKLKNVARKLRERDVKPVAIILISLPNGLLKDRYLNKFVSGKSYGKSARYHYEDGIFEILKEKTGEEIPRVLFVDLRKEYLSELKSFFDKINLLDYQIRRL